jgi:hypothetical protein
MLLIRPRDTSNLVTPTIPAATFTCDIGPACTRPAGYLYLSDG